MIPRWTFICLIFYCLLGDNNAQGIKTKFSCQGRITGYYADVETGCQVYHMCDGLGRQFSYTCPNATLFQQRMLICDHWYMVNCSQSENDYSANLLIGQKDKPFVGDYSRTPRPDLLSHRTQSEYNAIYRSGKTISGENLVGAESPDNNTISDKPLYSLPSHWSTEFSKQSTITTTTTTTTSPTTKKFTTTQFPVNFKSNFKATTPKFPLTVEPTTVPPNNIGVLPPLIQKLKPFYKATTDKPLVNFASKYKGTTPVYPLSVEATSVDPGDIGILPVKNDNEITNPLQTQFSLNEEPPHLNLGFEPPKFDENYKKRPPIPVKDIIIPAPSKFYQPPFEPDYTEQSNNENNNKFQSTNQWENLKRKFLIPEYEFPLDPVSPPSYDSVLSSFQTSET